MACKFLRLIYFLSVAYLSWCSEPPNQEVEALVTLKSAFIDPKGILNDWDESSVDPCTWAMVTCSPDNLVTWLEVPTRSLSGNLSGAIGLLTNLQKLILHNNNISGQIPAELGNLTKLEFLDLSNNHFSGRIPRSLCHLKSLHYMRLNNNSLSGTFPLPIMKMPKINFLDLSFNNLSGPLPTKIPIELNVMGNYLICGGHSNETYCGASTIPPPHPSLSENSSQSKPRLGVTVYIAFIGGSLGSTFLILLIVGLLLWWRNYKNNITNVDIAEDFPDMY